jgi:hypothetical protein
MTLYLTRSSRLWTLLILGLEAFLLRSEKKCHTLYVYTVPFFLTLAIWIYMTKTLGRLNKLFSRNF